MAAVRERQKIRHWPLEYLQTVLVQFEIADHLRMQQAHRVARSRIAEAGKKFLGHGGAADYAAPLEHAHFEPRCSEIARADQAIVAATDDNGVVFLRSGHLTDDTGEPAAGDIRGACHALISAMMKQEQRPPAKV
jgi:hypothetical protein